MPTLIDVDWQGNILEVLNLPTEAMAANFPNKIRVDCPVSTFDDFYDLDDLQVKPREPWEPDVVKEDINADGKDDFIVRQLPLGTQVFFDGNQYTVNDGQFELTTEQWGVGHIRLVPPGKKIKVVTFNALEP